MLATHTKGAAVGAAQTGHAQRPPRGSPDAGFTLAELLFAVSILTVVMVAILGALAFATTSSLSSARRAKALAIATDRIEWARNMDYDDVGVPGGEPPGTIPPTTNIGGYTVETTVTWAPDRGDGRPAYKEMYVTIRWSDGGPVAVASAIY